MESQEDMHMYKMMLMPVLMPKMFMYYYYVKLLLYIYDFQHSDLKGG